MRLLLFFILRWRLVKNIICVFVEELKYLKLFIYPFFKHNEIIIILFKGEIERMPSINTPDVAGLHANVAVQYCEDTIRSTWQGLSKLQIRSGRWKT